MSVAKVLCARPLGTRGHLVKWLRGTFLFLGEPPLKTPTGPEHTSQHSVGGAPSTWDIRAGQSRRHWQVPAPAITSGPQQSHRGFGRL